MQKKLIGRKGLEPSTAIAIEFTAQPVIPTNGTFLFLRYLCYSLDIYLNNLHVILVS